MNIYAIHITALIHFSSKVQQNNIDVFQNRQFFGKFLFPHIVATNYPHPFSISSSHFITIYFPISEAIPYELQSIFMQLPEYAGKLGNKKDFIFHQKIFLKKMPSQLFLESYSRCSTGLNNNSVKLALQNSKILVLEAAYV